MDVRTSLAILFAVAMAAGPAAGEPVSAPVGAPPPPPPATRAAGLPPKALPPSVWIIDDSAALEIYDCDGLMCGRIIWLLIPRDPQGELNLDKRNPAPALRTRRLCGLTILNGLHPAGKDLWKDGWFYIPMMG